MTDVEKYRLRRLVPKLRLLAREYPMRTLENIIQNIDARLQNQKEYETRRK